MMPSIGDKAGGISPYLRYIIAAVFLSCVSGLAQADEWDDCMKDNPDVRLAGCTVILSSQAITSSVRSSVFYNRALAFHAKKQWQKAIDDYSSAIKLNNTKPKYFFGRGVAYVRAYQYAQGIKDYTVAIKSNYRLHITYTNRGAAYMGLSQDDLALADYQRAQKINPDYAPLYHGLGFVYEMRGKRRAAITAYQRAIKLNPLDEPSRKRLKKLGVTP